MGSITCVTITATETLLNEADARFAINLVRSIMTYVDELL